MSQQTDDHVLDLASLPDWARAALAASTPATPVPPSVLAYREQPSWPLFVDAAVVGAFLPRELAPEALGASPRSDAEKAILGFSEITYCPDGTRWSLTREARREVLGAALNSSELVAAIGRTASSFQDPVSAALRERLRSSPPPPDLADLSGLERLEATRAAVALLKGVPGLALPAIEDLDREIELCRLLTQFERMVGQAPAGGLPGRIDGFFARDDERERLRRYVGVVSADSFSQLAGRAVYNLVNVIPRAIEGRPPMIVWGIGGVGKTTLIAKFMLEHARAAASRFPFAYLDFDRATISARDRAGLLAEMCQQVATQFAALAPAMTALQERLRDLGRKMEAGASSDAISLLIPCAGEFRKQVDAYLSSLESAFEWARPFVLVLDTFEVAQYMQGDVVGLEELVSAFSESGERTLWPRLRLILSGRQKADFLGKVEELKLGGLGAKGSCEMLMALAADAGKSITVKEADQLVTAIAKRLGEPPKEGVHPLRLRLVGQVFHQMKDADGTTIIRSLVDELSLPESAHGPIGRLFVDGVLVRRILGHVVDPRVRALADPGLVVRRITPEVIRMVMTPGTPRPDGTDRDDGDPGEIIDPWIVDQAEAESIFAAFARELSLVEPADGSSKALRHRQDVRQEMLTLIRDRHPRRFMELHRLAYEFFRAQAQANPADSASAAEAIYHGLWRGEPLTELDHLWQRDASFRPRLDPAEFADNPAASAYVRAKGQERLDASEIALLPQSVAVEWLAARSAALVSVPRLDEELPALLAAAGDDFAGLDEDVAAAAMMARLLFRAGLWQEAKGLIDRHLRGYPAGRLVAPSQPGSMGQSSSGGRRQAVVSLLRTWATLAAKSGAPAGELESIRETAPMIHEPLLRVEVLAYLHLGLAQGARAGSAGGWPSPDSDSAALRSAIDEARLKVRPDEWRREPRILRLGILTGGEDVGDLLDIYLRESEGLPRDPDAAGEVAGLFQMVLQQDRLAGDEVPLRLEVDRTTLPIRVLESVDAVWRRERPAFLRAARADPNVAAAVRRLVVFDHHDWTWVLGNALTRALEGKGAEAARIGKLVDGLDLRGASVRGKSRARQGDGLGIIHAAVDLGQLLRLAQSLNEGAPTVAAATDRPFAYPQSVSSVAGALLRWHRTLLDQLDRSAPTAV